jgi:hypothetical protein
MATLVTTVPRPAIDRINPYWPPGRPRVSRTYTTSRAMTPAKPRFRPALKRV